MRKRKASNGCSICPVEATYLHLREVWNFDGFAAHPRIHGVYASVFCLFHRLRTFGKVLLRNRNLDACWTSAVGCIVSGAGTGAFDLNASVASKASMRALIR
jgi:hypothetical protein